MIKIGIVTIVYNSEHVIDDFLNSLNKQSFNDFELFIIDNNSRDKTISKIKNYYPKMKEDKIKQLIWCFSSSLNKREYIVYDEKLRDEWDKIRKVVRYVQKACRFY